METKERMNEDKMKETSQRKSLENDVPFPIIKVRKEQSL